MGRRAATALHLALILLGAVAYVVFVLPRWWVLIGAVPSTLATAGRIAAALPIGAAAVPVWLSLQRSLKPSMGTPELALRLRAWSAVLHVVAALLILLAAIAEIWLPLDVGGPWLFAVYGAAAAIVILAVAGFYLSFVAEKPPAPPKPPKAKKEKAPKEAKPAKKARGAAMRRGKKAETVPAAAPDDVADGPEAAADTTGTAETVIVEAETVETVEVREAGQAETVETEAAETAEADSPAESADAGDETADPTPEEPAPQAGGLRNKRPAGKRRHRLGR